MVIIFPNDAGGIAVMIPNPNSGLTVEQTAKRDVPTGKPFLIVQDSDIPTNRTYRDAWTADFSTPDGHGGDA